MRFPANWFAALFSCVRGRHWVDGAEGVLTEQLLLAQQEVRVLACNEDCLDG